MPAKLDKAEKKLLADVKKTGWHVIKVLADEEGPGFAYSIGLYETFGHPEIIIVGLKDDVAHGLINRIGEAIREGRNSILENFIAALLMGLSASFLPSLTRTMRSMLALRCGIMKGTGFT